MLYLASGSPRRRTLLQQAGVDFEVMVSDCDETTPPDLSPAETVQILSQRKAETVAAKCRNEDVILAADTVVAIDSVILGKPVDRADAGRMLRMLSGREHSVFTGVSVVCGKKTQTFVTETKVFFYPLSETEIDEYIATGEPMDKAGAYGIQGKGAVLVEKICGDYNNVVGLPLAQTIRVLHSFGI